MFKKFMNNHELRVRVAQTDSPSEDPAPEMEIVPHVEPEQITDLIKDVVKYTAVTVSCVVGGLMVLNTICEVVANMSKDSDKDD